jgi:hypothetical protein
MPRNTPNAFPGKNKATYEKDKAKETRNITSGRYKQRYLRYLDKLHLSFSTEWPQEGACPVLHRQSGVGSI